MKTSYFPCSSKAHFLWSSQPRTSAGAYLPQSCWSCADLHSECFFFLICWFWHRPYCWFNELSVINRITDPRGLILSCLTHWRVTVTMVNNCLKSNQNYSFKFECRKCLHSDLFRGNLLPLSSSQRKKMAPKEQMSTPQMLPLWELHRRQCWGQLQSAETGGCEAGMWPNCDCSLPTTAFFLPSGLG